MYYVYFLKSKKYNESYIGSTNDLRRRLFQHNKGAETSTKRYKPWRLVYYEAYQSEKDARERETKLKNHGNAVRELKKRTQRSLKNGAKKGLPSTTFRKRNSDLGLPSTIFRKSKNGAGFTMIEMLAALFVVSVGIMGVFSLVSQTISYISIISSRLTAIYLSQEGMEIIRNIRDSNFLKINKGEVVSWDDGLFNGQYYNFDYESQAIPDNINCSGNNHLDISGDFYKCLVSGRFQREAKITKIGDNQINVVIEVSWQERGRAHQVVVQESLYQWYKSEEE